MHSYRSGSLVKALLLSLVAQAEALLPADPSTCACGEPGVATTVTETHTVTAEAPTVTLTHTPDSSESASGSAVPTKVVYVTSGSTIPQQTVTVTAPAQIVTETRTYYVTDGSTIPASTVVVTATATASVVTVTQPPRTVIVRGSDTIIPSVITVTETQSQSQTNAPEPGITTTAGEETGSSDNSQPTGTSSVVPPADHHCHKNGTCHNHPGTSYSVTQIDLPTFCGVSTVMETVFNTITQTVYPGEPSTTPSASLGNNSTLPLGTGASVTPVHTVVAPRLRDARFEHLRGYHY